MIVFNKANVVNITHFCKNELKVLIAKVTKQFVILRWLKLLRKCFLYIVESLLQQCSLEKANKMNVFSNFCWWHHNK